MPKKRYVALARVSSREQEREGFSLDVQVDGLNDWAARNGGDIVKQFRVAETASKANERHVFKEMLSYCRQHAHELDALLVYKLDRVARNFLDYAEIENLETLFGLPMICTSQPMANDALGRFQRRSLANVATLQTELQSRDVREGQARRVQEGFFPCKAPFGYRNVRIDGRGLVEINPVQGPNVKRIFDLYAYYGHTLDTLSKTLVGEAIIWTDAKPKFTRSKLYSILRDRAYIGEIRYGGRWFAGRQPALVDRITFDRVQALLGGKSYNQHSSVYGSGLVQCGHCGHPVVVEIKTKQTKKGPRDYIYYRCARYTSEGHPSVRVTEADLDRQVLDLLSRMRQANCDTCDWIMKALRTRTVHDQEQRQRHVKELRRQLDEVERQQGRLLDRFLTSQHDEQLLAQKEIELRDRRARLQLEIEAQDRQRAEKTDLVIKTFELSQAIVNKWLSSDISEKRLILQMICLNRTLDGVNLVMTIRKPFALLLEGLVSTDIRGDKI